MMVSKIESMWTYQQYRMISGPDCRLTLLGTWTRTSMATLPFDYNHPCMMGVVQQQMAQDQQSSQQYMIVLTTRASSGGRQWVVFVNMIGVQPLKRCLELDFGCSTISFVVSEFGRLDERPLEMPVQLILVQLVDYVVDLLEIVVVI